jgi:hypothetical protein
MKSKPIKNVSLTYACGKNWNDMIEVAGGRFCDSCQHVVHDFTNKSDCELKKILQQNSRVCGKFKLSQMSADFLKYAAATVVAATTGVTTNSCTEEEIFPTSHEITANEVRFEESLAPDTTAIETFTVGIVYIEPKEVHSTEMVADENLETSAN